MSLFPGSPHPSDNCGFDPLMGCFWTYKGWCEYIINRQRVKCFSHAPVLLHTNPLTFAVSPKSRPLCVSLAPSQALNLPKHQKAFFSASLFPPKSLKVKETPWFSTSKKWQKNLNPLIVHLSRVWGARGWLHLPVVPQVLQRKSRLFSPLYPLL